MSWLRSRSSVAKWAAVASVNRSVGVGRGSGVAAAWSLRLIGLAVPLRFVGLPGLPATASAAGLLGGDRLRAEVGHVVDTRVPGVEERPVAALLLGFWC